MEQQLAQSQVTNKDCKVQISHFLHFVAVQKGLEEEYLNLDLLLACF
jgi:hypothetical protein